MVRTTRGVSYYLVLFVPGASAMIESPLVVVTSFSEGGWRKYGSKFVETFNTYWPTDVELHLVSEDAFDLELNSPRKIKFWHLEESTIARDFLKRYANQLWAHGNAGAAQSGLPQGSPKWGVRTGYCFRHDAYKFSKKVFAIEMVAMRINAFRLFWIDADVITFAPVTDDLYPLVLPDSAILSYLPRQDHYHSECGFIGYNLRDAKALHFIRRFADLYVSGKVFELPEWHDSWVFDWLRKDLNLTGAYRIPHGSNQHPFINSALGRFMDHLKGNRKVKGRSLPVEQLKHTSIPYWDKRMNRR